MKFSYLVRREEDTREAIPKSKWFQSQELGHLSDVSYVPPSSPTHHFLLLTHQVFFRC